jgi:predicted amidohydrolase YtcJ
MLTLSAIDAAGVLPGDRVEHGAIITDDALAWIKSLGVTVVTQPLFLTQREMAYRADVPPEDHPNLWRVGSIKRENIPMAFGSDAPFESYNPWKVMAAAVNRPKGFGSNEGLSPEDALAAYCKPAHDAGAAPRRIAAGQPADMCLLSTSWDHARERLPDVKVSATWIGGDLVYQSIDEAPV